jgi:hypothetical protein
MDRRVTPLDTRHEVGKRLEFGGSATMEKFENRPLAPTIRLFPPIDL